MGKFGEQSKIEGKIEKLRITDEDVFGWMESLREGGLRDDEIDLMLEDLNQKYAEQKLSKEIKESWGRIIKTVERRRGFKMSEEEKETLFDYFLNLTKHHRAQ